MYNVHLAFAMSRCILSTIMAYPRKTSPEAIREAAVSLLKQEGVEGLTLRRVAAALGVVPNALYRHFPNREGLVAAVGDEAARELLARMRTAADDAASPEGRVRALARAYSRYFVEQPALHSMLVAPTTEGEAALPGPLGKEMLWSFVVEEISKIVGSEIAVDASVTLWAVLEGQISLKRSGLMGGRRPDDIGDFPIDLYLSGLRGLASAQKA